MIKTNEIKIQENIIKSLLELIPQITDHHSPYSSVYKYLSKTSNYSVVKLFGPEQNSSVDLDILGKIKLPYYSMGAINSTHLFGLDELILFCFYFKNRFSYKKVADLGANIGLHSIILSNLGFKVTSYEPDLIHFNKIKENIDLNCSKNKPIIINKAISTKNGNAEFIRVKNNTTGSHLSGAKESYGQIEKLKVETVSFNEIIKNFDFLKMDIEGHEAEVLISTTLNEWEDTDAMIEVGNEINGKKIFEFFKDIKVNMFSQKINWQPVKQLEDMPSSYKEGSLFISCKNNGPW